MQKILIIKTVSPRLRDEAFFQCIEDDAETETYNEPHHVFQTPLHAIRAGWVLMAPPTTFSHSNPGDDCYEWWFTKTTTASFGLQRYR